MSSIPGLHQTIFGHPRSTHWGWAPMAAIGPQCLPSGLGPHLTTTGAGRMSRRRLALTNLLGSRKTSGMPDSARWALSAFGHRRVKHRPWWLGASSQARQWGRPPSSGRQVPNLPARGPMPEIDPPGRGAVPGRVIPALGSNRALHDVGQGRVGLLTPSGLSTATTPQSRSLWLWGQVADVQNAGDLPALAVAVGCSSGLPSREQILHRTRMPIGKPRPADVALADMGSRVRSRIRPDSNSATSRLGSAAARSHTRPAQSHLPMKAGLPAKRCAQGLDKESNMCSE